MLGGRGTHRVLSVEGGTEVALTGFIITDGLAAGDVGGCILNGPTRLLGMTQVVVDNCHAVTAAASTTEGAWGSWVVMCSRTWLRNGARASSTTTGF